MNFTPTTLFLIFTLVVFILAVKRFFNVAQNKSSFKSAFSSTSKDDFKTLYKKLNQQKETSKEQYQKLSSEIALTNKEGQENSNQLATLTTKMPWLEETVSTLENAFMQEIDGIKRDVTTFKSHIESEINVFRRDTNQFIESLHEKLTKYQQDVYLVKVTKIGTSKVILQNDLYPLESALNHQTNTSTSLENRIRKPENSNTKNIEYEETG